MPTPEEIHQINAEEGPYQYSDAAKYQKGG